ncbi:MAG: hypothetical protein JST00_20995 [Deltaproteobacteria bacterium]|nr:hypothetical protein [Deltaproteobacteria bacterium]
MRRALVGSVFRAIASSIDDVQQQALVLQAHVVAWLVFVLLLVRDAAFALRSRVGDADACNAGERRWIGMGALAMFFSQLIPTIGSLAGYLDVYILILFLCSARLLRQRRWISAGLLAAVAPFVHDGFFFLWLTPAACGLAELWQSRTRTGARSRVRELWLPLAMTLLPIATTVVVLCAHSSNALSGCLAELPPGAADIRVFEMPLSWMLRRMYDLISHHPGNLIAASCFFGWPFLVTVGCAAQLGEPRQRSLKKASLLAAAAALPASILFVAWDLTRFVVWVHLGAFVVLCHRAARVLEDRERRDRASADAPRTSAKSTVAAAATAALIVSSVGGPAVFSYFGATFAHYRIGPRALAETPAAWLTYAYIRFSNREMARAGFASRGEGTGGSCTLEPHDVALDASCGAVLGASGRLETPALMLVPGKYVVRMTTEALPQCATARVVAVASARWRLAPSLGPAATLDTDRLGEALLAFDVDGELSAMGDIRVDVRAREGCFRLTSLVVERSSSSSASAGQLR